MAINKQELINKIQSIDSLSLEDKSALIDLIREQKKYGIVWEDKPEEVEGRLDYEIPVLTEINEYNGIKPILSNNPDAPNHILIEGDNLHSLIALSYTHAGKFDVIYIDPPYNTGAKNWRYNNDYVDGNDSYRHSKWISMMNKRLKIAKTLLKEKGVLICAIDENEVAQLKLLLEEVFGSGYEYVCVTVVHNPRGIQGKNFSYTHEFAIFVIPKGDKIIGGRKIPENEVDWSPLRNWGGESLRTDAKNCFYPIIIKDGKIISFGDIPDNDFHPTKNVHNDDGTISVYPIVDGVEHKWRYARQSVEQIKSLLRVSKKKNVYDIELGKPYGTYKTVWVDNRYDANAYGKKLINEIIPECPFDFPKSIYNVYDCLYAVIGDKKDALILDFFAGSGTTMHATMLMNSEDNGHRQCILATNNENNICQEVTFVRNKRVIEGFTKQNGEAVPGLTNNNLRYYRAEFVPKEPTNKNKRQLVSAATGLLCIKNDVYMESPLFCGKKYKSGLMRYFDNGKTKMLIIYDERAVIPVAELIRQSDFEGKIMIYVFSNSRYAYDDEFMEVADKVNLCALPAAIYDAYKRVMKPKARKDVSTSNLVEGHGVATESDELFSDNQ